MIIVPPFLKSVSGPLLGPAMLVGSARSAGFRVDIGDLNAAYISGRLDLGSFTPGPFIGDHDRPSGALRTLQRAFAATCNRVLPERDAGLGECESLTLTYGHQEVQAAAHALAADPEVGGWIERQLAGAPRPPAVVGVSVLYSGQVLWALAASIVAKRMWPEALVIWGGSHVTALRDAIAADPEYGFAVDHFVVGHAERTFVEILRARERHSTLPAEAMVAGAGRWVSAKDDPGVVPDFRGTRLDWPRPTLPAQSSRGCAYGRCSFCTYPAIEGAVRLAPDAHLVGVLEAAIGRGAAVSLKDSLVIPTRLERVAGLIDGRVRWSACTKLHARIDAAFARSLAASGCATIEVGLETLTSDGQLLFDKRQTPDLFVRVTEALAAAGISVVVNYMTGLPGVDHGDEQRWLAWVQMATARLGALGKVEHNGFQLERLSPMGEAPGRYGLVVTRTWPWASVMAWEPRGRVAGEDAPMRHAPMPVEV